MSRKIDLLDIALIIMLCLLIVYSAVISADRKNIEKRYESPITFTYVSGESTDAIRVYTDSETGFVYMIADTEKGSAFCVRLDENGQPMKVRY